MTCITARKLELLVWNFSAAKLNPAVQTFIDKIFFCVLHALECKGFPFAYLERLECV
jgi:bacteriorhodopsin